MVQNNKLKDAFSVWTKLRRFILRLEKNTHCASMTSCNGYCIQIVMEMGDACGCNMRERNLIKMHS